MTEQRTDSLNGDARVVGDVVSNGEVIVDNSARVDGNILASYVRITGGSSVTGEVSIREDRDALMPFDIPPGLEDLGHVAPKPGDLELSRGSYLAASIKLQNGAQLLIDNRSGPVTIYVSESVEVSGGSAVELPPTPTRRPLPSTSAAAVRFGSRTTVSTTESSTPPTRGSRLPVTHHSSAPS